MKTNHEYLEMVEELLDRGNLTKWEDSFLVSISDQLERGHRLTVIQEATLYDIYDKRS